MKNPCYNEVTKTGCPKRAAGCAINCPEWAKHVEEREARYREKKATGDIAAAINRFSVKRMDAYRKKNRK